MKFKTPTAKELKALRDELHGKTTKAGKFGIGNLRFPTLAHAETRAQRTSIDSPSAQIGVYEMKAGDKKYVTVYLNGSKLPRSAWFVGFKK